MKKTKINNVVIRDFINDFYRIKIQSNSRDTHIVKARMFYYYMCFKFSNDIVSAKQVGLSINRKQHGTVLGHIESMEELKIYDKFSFKKYQVLESAFLEKYEPFKSDENFKIDSKDDLLIKAKLRRVIRKNILLNHKIKNLKIRLGEELLKKSA